MATAADGPAEPASDSVDDNFTRVVEGQKAMMRDLARDVFALGEFADASTDVLALFAHGARPELRLSPIVLELLGYPAGSLRGDCGRLLVQPEATAQSALAAAAAGDVTFSFLVHAADGAAVSVSVALHRLRQARAAAARCA